MLDYLKDATIGEIVEDVMGALLLFGMLFLSPYAIAIVKALQ